jgi:hypothetical protein
VVTVLTGRSRLRPLRCTVQAPALHLHSRACACVHACMRDRRPGAKLQRPAGPVVANRTQYLKCHLVLACHRRVELQVLRRPVVIYGDNVAFSAGLAGVR